MLVSGPATNTLWARDAAPESEAQGQPLERQATAMVKKEALEIAQVYKLQHMSSRHLELESVLQLVKEGGSSGWVQARRCSRTASGCRQI
jgi:hypothetical protein